MAAWLAAGHFDSWSCEDEATEKSDGDPAIHVHGPNRICSNERLHTGSLVDEWPAGVASVKELHDDGAAISGYAVYVKVAGDSAKGRSFYYYEGASTAGFGLPACIGCHSAAGTDADHPGAGDFVYERE
jgi:hypothetical protein